VCLQPCDPSPENMAAAVRKAGTVTNNRGIAMSSWGPGVRVRPEDLATHALSLLGSAEAADDFMLRTTGLSCDVMGVPWDISGGGLQRLLRTRAPRLDLETGFESMGWHCTVEKRRNGGRKGPIWRVRAEPTQELPQDFSYRGRLIACRCTPPPTKRQPTLCRVPAPGGGKKKRGSGQGQAKAKVEPAWKAGWSPEKPEPPSWAQRLKRGLLKEEREESAERAEAEEAPEDWGMEGAEDRPQPEGEASPAPKISGKGKGTGMGAAPGSNCTAEGTGAAAFGAANLAALAAMIPTLQVMCQAFVAGGLTGNAAMGGTSSSSYGPALGSGGGAGGPYGKPGAEEDDGYIYS